MKVVVIDPSSAVRSRVVARLREARIEVIGDTATIPEALPVIASLFPDAVVTEALFSTCRGVEVVSLLRSAAPDARLVILSNETHLRTPCLSNGAHAFLDKSSEFDTLVDTLRGGR